MIIKRQIFILKIVLFNLFLINMTCFYKSKLDWMVFGSEIVAVNDNNNKKEPKNIINRKILGNFNGFSDTAEIAIKAVVNVSTTQILASSSQENGSRILPRSPFEEFFKDFFDHLDRPKKVQALGSGFVIQFDNVSALIVTNYHVVAEAKKITIIFHDGVETEAKIVNYDDRTDIALLKINLNNLPKDKRNLTLLEFGDSNQSKVGDWVLAIGNPFGLGSTVTAGIISNRSRNISNRSQTKVSEFVDDFIQHDASINMGNSGGPIINLDGKVIGINTAIFSPSGGNVGIGFAIPSNLAKNTIDQMLKFGRIKRGWLGVKIQTVTDAMAESIGLDKPIGVMIGSVVPESPAEKAKPFPIKPGDIIVEFANQEVNEKSKLARLVNDSPIGKEIEVKIWNKGKMVKTYVILDESLEAKKREVSIKNLKKNNQSLESVKMMEIQGLKLSNLSEDIKNRYKISKESHGILVINVNPESQAYELGIQSGDLIIEVNQKKINNLQDLIGVINQTKKEGKKNILLLISHKGDTRFVALKID